MIKHCCSLLHHHPGRLDYCAAMSIRGFVASHIRCALHSMLEAALFPTWMLIHCSAGVAAVHRAFCDLLSCDAGHDAPMNRIEKQVVVILCIISVGCYLFRCSGLVYSHLVCVGKWLTVDSVATQRSPESDATSCTAEPEVTACTARSAGTAAYLTCTACTPGKHSTAGWRVTAGQAEACDAARATTGRACFVCYRALMGS